MSMATLSCQCIIAWHNTTKGYLYDIYFISSFSLVFHEGQTFPCVACALYRSGCISTILSSICINVHNAIENLHQSKNSVRTLIFVNKNVGYMLWHITFNLINLLVTLKEEHICKKTNIDNILLYDVLLMLIHLYD